MPSSKVIFVTNVLHRLHWLHQIMQEAVLPQVGPVAYRAASEQPAAQAMYEKLPHGEQW
jgi:hypothetical protein